MEQPLRRLDGARLGDHLTLLHRSAWTLCGSREQAEDLVQETCARVLARPRFMRNGDDSGYLLRALRNTYLSQQREEGRQPRGDAVAADWDPVDPRGHTRPDRAAETRALYAAIPQLPEDYRLALVAVDVTGLSYQEAARELRVPVGTVRSRLFRAREQMVELLGGGPEHRPARRTLAAAPQPATRTRTERDAPGA